MLLDQVFQVKRHKFLVHSHIALISHWQSKINFWRFQVLNSSFSIYIFYHFLGYQFFNICMFLVSHNNKLGKVVQVHIYGWPVLHERLIQEFDFLSNGLPFICIIKEHLSSCFLVFFIHKSENYLVMSYQGVDGDLWN